MTSSDAKLCVNIGEWSRPSTYFVMPTKVMYTKLDRHFRLYISLDFFFEQKSIQFPLWWIFFAIFGIPCWFRLLTWLLTRNLVKNKNDNWKPLFQTYEIIKSVLLPVDPRKALDEDFLHLEKIMQANKQRDQYQLYIYHITFIKLQIE